MKILSDFIFNYSELIFRNFKLIFQHIGQGDGRRILNLALQLLLCNIESWWWSLPFFEPHDSIVGREITFSQPAKKICRNFLLSRKDIHDRTFRYNRGHTSSIATFHQGSEASLKVGNVKIHHISLNNMHITYENMAYIRTLKD